jgi:SAM-dependent methyltransferase
MEQEIKSEFTCLVCGGQKFEPQCSSMLLHCLECGFVTANVRLSEEEIRKIYSEKYFAGEEYEDYVRDKVMLQKNFSARLKKICSIIPANRIADVLEIGCAYGFFGELIKRKIPNSTYLGFDASWEAVAYAKEKLGLNASAENYIEWKSEKKFTDIFMWDVIEHLERPDSFITKIAQDSVSGSRLYITTGDIGSWLARRQGCRWRMIHPPSHLHYFSKDTITLLLKKNGFTVKRIFYSPTSRSVKGIFYSLFMLRKNYSRWVGKIYHTIPENLSVAINTFDIMFVIAEKN